MPHFGLAPRPQCEDLAKALEYGCNLPNHLGVDSISQLPGNRGPVRVGVDHEPTALQRARTAEKAAVPLQNHDRDSLLRVLAEQRSDISRASSMLSMGLLNALNVTEFHDQVAVTDDLLRYMRELASPNNVVARKNLAVALYHVINHTAIVVAGFTDLEESEINARQRRRDGLLAELQRLADTYRSDASLMEIAVMGMVTVFQQVHESSYRDKLLQDLRVLVVNHPMELNLTKQLATALYLRLFSAHAEANLEVRKALLQDLRDLAATQADNIELQRVFAVGLTAVLFQANDYGQLESGACLLQELRQLFQRHPDDL